MPAWLVLFAAVAVVQAPTARVHGHVSDASHARIPGARVVVVDGAGGVHEATTDRQGAYTVDRLAPGDGTVLIYARGFADFRQPVTVAAGQDLTVDASLEIAVQRQTIVVEGGATFGADPAANASATILKGKDLDALSDDPNELEAQLHALAGAAAGPNGGQIYIDGFTGGKLPPKHAIQEIRVNQNPYAAEFDVPGSGRIEIITKPGGGALHGRFLADGNHAALNSRNPFLPRGTSYHSNALMGSLDGPLGPRATFFFVFDDIYQHDASAVNAVTLDAAFDPVRVQQSFPALHRITEIDPRVDLQPSAHDTASARYRLYRSSDSGGGVGQFALPSQAFTVRKTEHALQLSDLHVVSARTVIDTRLEYRRFESAQTAADASPQITVAGAFTGGGSGAGNQRTVQQHVELHGSIASSAGAHLFKAGAALRVNATSDRSTQGFNGSFMFASLEAFRITQIGVAQGLPADAIRAEGGGASQFSIAAGQPAVAQTLTDAALFAQDDWRLTDRTTLSAGLRYETQTALSTAGSLAPRVSMARAFGSPKGRAALWVVRAGAGLFYDRIPQTLFLEARRLDGSSHTTQFIVGSPDFYPTVPSRDALAGNQLSPTVYRISRAISPPAMLQSSATIERRLGKASTAAVGYVYSHGWNQLLSINLRAPRPGSAPQTPLYEFESAGMFNQQQLTANVNLKLRSWLTTMGSYVLGSARADSNGATSFPSSTLDLRADYGRAAFDVRQRVTMFFQFEGPGFRVIPSVVAATGRPFDITVGQDLNQDSIFNDRPAFATDPARPSVVVTRFGAFDTAPVAAQRIIPRNSGTGPAQCVVNLRVMKPFVVRRHDTIRVDLVAGNLLNRVNLAAPVGNLASPLFGRSTSLSNAGPSGTNRQVRVQLQFMF